MRQNVRTAIPWYCERERLPFGDAHFSQGVGASERFPLKSWISMKLAGVERIDGLLRRVVLHPSQPLFDIGVRQDFALHMAGPYHLIELGRDSDIGNGL